MSLACYGMVFYNFFYLSKDLIYGDGSGENAVPQPRYELLRIPKEPKSKRYKGENRLASDYSQIYFPSQDFEHLSQNYETGVRSPFTARSRYAPFIHYLCTISFCKLDYGYASFLHMLTQMLVFYLIFAATFKMLGVQSDLWVGLLLANVFMFLTPAGLGWFERGQFSLYVALSYLLLMLGLWKNKPTLIFVSALFAYVKWTALPFLTVIFAAYLLGSKNKMELVRNIRAALMYAAVFLVLSLAFRSKFIHFVEGLYMQEIYDFPKGISLTYILPAGAVKILPLLMVLIGWLYLRWRNISYEDLLPYFIGSGILLIVYPTIAYEYNLVSLLCFVPLVFYWMKRAGLIARIASYGFFIFILAASSTNFVSPFLNYAVPTNTIIAGYIAISVVFILIPLFNQSQARDHPV